MFLNLIITYCIVKIFGGKKLQQIWQITAILQVFFQFSHNFHCIVYGFTISCYPSMLERLLGLSLLTSRFTHIAIWYHMASSLWQ